MDNILITGGSGLIGSYLKEALIERGYNVSILSRKSSQNSIKGIYNWDIDKKQIDTEALKSINYIIHLAGVNIGDKRWTSARKKKIVDSRTKTSELLFETIRINDNKIKAIISASAIGYYGAKTSDKIYQENDLPATDFLGETCELWEQGIDKFTTLGIRTVKIRTGVVLTKKGGALEKLKNVIVNGLGAPVGTGNQYMPWIHIDDLCEIYIKAIEDNKMKGVYNAVAPNHSTNIFFTNSLAQVLQKRLWLPYVPSFLLKIILGEMSDMILKGSRVSSDKIIRTGFKFKFGNLKNALEDLLIV